MTFIDVSRHQGTIDWPRVRAAGVRVAVIRLATGSRLDDQFRRNWVGAHAAGIPRIGWYQYFITEEDGLEQARAALEFTQGAMGTEPPTVDCERRADERLAPWSWAKRQAYTLSVRKWLLALSAYRPRIYTSKWEWQAITTLPDWITEYDLWLAAYPGPPELPAKATRYSVHQYSSTGRVDGIAGPVDLNVETTPPAPPLHLDPAPAESETAMQYLLTVRDTTTTAAVTAALGGHLVALQAVIPIDLPPPVPVVVSPPSLYTVRIKVAVLNVRSGPGTTNPIVNTLALGTLAAVYEERAGWGRIAPEVQQWINVGPVYVERVPPAI